jgi:hypothetical protein
VIKTASAITPAEECFLFTGIPFFAVEFLSRENSEILTQRQRDDLRDAWEQLAARLARKRVWKSNSIVTFRCPSET